MRVGYRIVAVVLTVSSAFLLALLITVALRDDQTIRPWYFAGVAVGAILMFVLALVLWARAAKN